MKKNFLFAMAMAAVFAGCSSDDDALNSHDSEITGDRYVAVSISMPTTTQTRNEYKEDNDHLVDGLPSEYEVKTVDLLIFNGTSLSSTLIEKKTLETYFSPTSDDPNQITSSSTKIVQEVSGSVSAGNGLLVVLNNNGLINDTNAPIGCTLSSIWTGVNGVTTSTLFDNSHGFFMTNAPLATQAPNSKSAYPGEIKLLTAISQVYKTEAEARSAAAPDQVYVERAMAKVTMNSGNGSLTNKVNSTTMDYNITGWVLGNTNTESFLIRNTTTSLIQDWGWLNSTSSNAQSGFRFVGTQQVKTGVELYRTYFAKDPNYDINDGASKFDATMLANADVSKLSTEFGNEAPQYCMENTFDVDHMTHLNTTHVLLQVKLGNGSDFYLLDGAKDKTYTLDNVKNHISNLLDWTTLESKLVAEETLATTDLEFTFDYSNKDNVVLTGLSTSKALTNLTDINALLSLMATDIASKTSIAFYESGISYYAARIKHFDEFTPWRDGEDPQPGSVGTTGAYPSSSNRDANYLGRYGVLRNNWYDLKVSAIKTIGSADPNTVIGEENNNDTDDELEQYVVMQINILSWAKRSQNVEL